MVMKGWGQNIVAQELSAFYTVQEDEEDHKREKRDSKLSPDDHNDDSSSTSSSDDDSDVGQGNNNHRRQQLRDRHAIDVQVIEIAEDDDEGEVELQWERPGVAWSRVQKVLDLEVNQGLCRMTLLASWCCTSLPQQCMYCYHSLGSPP